MINNLTLVGRCGRDPESKSFGSGAMVATLNVAVTRPTEKKETDWFTVKIWGKQADIVMKYVRKGHLVGICGRIEEEKWEKDGQKHSKVVVVASQVRLMQPKGDDQGAPADVQESGDIFGSADEIPF